MIKLLFGCICLCTGLLLTGQTTISGQVKDKKGQAVAFANVYLKEVFDGGSTDDQGNFTFTTEAKGNAILVVSSINYENYEQTINLDEQTIQLQIELESGGNDLGEVVVSAGAFEASDEKKGTILKPLDIVTNPAASADVYGALQTLPGVTPVGEETGLFVRGGEASETKTIIDGALVAKPFFGDVPDIPARGRFNPFLFKGTLFSTGGYSAQYGQALSSVLILETEDLPKDDEYSIGINMAGIQGSVVRVWNERTSLLANVNYTNLEPLFSIVPQNRDWIRPPNGVGGALGFRHLNQSGGLYKSYLQYQNGNIALAIPGNQNQGTTRDFSNNNQNLFWTNSYRGIVGKDLGVFASASISYDDDRDRLGTDEFGSKEWFGQARVTLSRELGAFFVRLGNEVHLTQGDYYFNEESSLLKNEYNALYLESDIRFSKKFAGRIGIRSEYASILNLVNLMPRASFTYKAGKNSLLSLAYGQFFQTPEPEFLWESAVLGFEKSTHYIMNYQWQTDRRIFRIEAYYKDYDELVQVGEPGGFNNQGYGYSRGIDVFWRDQKSIPNLTYWLSYSYIDTERLYRDFPTAATPTFVSDHVLSFIANYYITPRIRLGTSYSFASGRPYFNPGNPQFLADKAIDYHNLNISSSYLTSLFGNFTVIYASLRNPFGVKQVFGYRYNEDGTQRTPIIPASDWSFFAGISISIKK